MFKSVRERKSIVVSLKVDLMLSSIVILIIAHVFSSSVPAQFIRLSLQNGLFLLLLWVDQNFHSLIIKTFGFDHIKHVEFYLESLLDIAYPEEEPLSMAFWVYVILQDEVIFVITDFVSKLEVAWFKSGFEYKSFVVWILWCVVVEWGERYWLWALLVLVIGTDADAVLGFEQLLKVASPYQLIEIVGIKFLIWIVKELSESWVHDGVLLAFLEFAFVFKVEQMTQRCLCVLSLLDYLLNFLLFTIAFSIRSSRFLTVLLLLCFIVNAADGAERAVSTNGPLSTSWTLPW